MAMILFWTRRTPTPTAPNLTQHGTTIVPGYSETEARFWFARCLAGHGYRLTRTARAPLPGARPHTTPLPTHAQQSPRPAAGHSGALPALNPPAVPPLPTLVTGVGPPPPTDLETHP